MRHYAENVKEVVREKKLVAVTCDVCGARTEREDPIDWAKPDEWRHSQTVTISKNWTCDGDCDLETVDLCFECCTSLFRAIKNGVPFDTRPERRAG